MVLNSGISTSVQNDTVLLIAIHALPFRSGKVIIEKADLGSVAIHALPFRSGKEFFMVWIDVAG